MATAPRKRLSRKERSWPPVMTRYYKQEAAATALAVPPDLAVSALISVNNLYISLTAFNAAAVT